MLEDNMLTWISWWFQSYYPSLGLLYCHHNRCFATYRWQWQSIRLLVSPEMSSKHSYWMDCHEMSPVDESFLYRVQVFSRPLKYLNIYCIDRHKLWYRHLWFPETLTPTFTDALTFPLAPMWGSHLLFLVKCLNHYVWITLKFGTYIHDLIRIDW